ncbi:hypothetical protein [Goodfellowiella coeruleoviolacea]|uniref:Uncharacterized protein n=1 Tax=Goodfellowiella coeruleoviolacea TaxID=334858 RepID=A0AAE3GC21_9PSEU|nr:hypothetical protein [Goodfellowiella coeruleoviolacea]MCP2164655.1 hypothetical protein [Goodfellowiella coeruleoviolacea]
MTFRQGNNSFPNFPLIKTSRIPNVVVVTISAMSENSSTGVREPLVRNAIEQIPARREEVDAAANGYASVAIADGQDLELSTHLGRPGD